MILEFKELVNLIPLVKKKKKIGYKDILQYHDWGRDSLEIHEKCNVFLEYLDYYIKNEIIKEKNLSIVRFIGSRKSWVNSFLERYLRKAKLILKRKWKAFLY